MDFTLSIEVSCLWQSTAKIQSSDLLTIEGSQRYDRALTTLSPQTEQTTYPKRFVCQSGGIEFTTVLFVVNKGHLRMQITRSGAYVQKTPRKKTFYHHSDRID
jgi:hypothetical protein